MAKYMKKPVVIEAEQFIGNYYGPDPRGLCRELGHGIEDDGNGKAFPHVHTMHDGQTVKVEVWDWVIAEPDGVHFYPCKPDVFADRYEPAY